MSLLIKATDLIPCPFCAGPPVTFVRDVIKDRELSIPEEWPEDGVFVEAAVFCHECGAHGEDASGVVYLDSCFAELVNKSRTNWNGRNKRHQSLFEASREVNESNDLDAYFTESAKKENSSC